MTKRNLYSSISLLTVVSFLTACGDGTTTSNRSSQENSVVEAPATVEQALTENSSRAAEALDAVAEVIAETDRVVKGLGLSIDPDAETPDTPKWDAVVQIKKEADLAFGELDSSAQALSSIDKARNSYNALLAAYGSYAQRYQAFSEKVDLLGRAVSTYEASDELAIRGAETKDALRENLAFLMSSLASVTENTTRSFQEVGLLLKERQDSLTRLGAKAENGIFSPTNFGDNLRKHINTVSTIKFDEALSGHQMKFMPLVTADASENEDSKRILIQQLFNHKEMLDLVKDGKLEEVAAKVYTDVVSPRMALEFVHKVNTFSSNDTTYYTFAELESIIQAAQGKDQAGVLALAGKKDVEGLNSKPYPVFDNKAGKNRTIPELEKVKALQAEVALKVSALIQKFLLENDVSQVFFPASEAVTALLSGSIKDLSGNVSFRDARMSLTGRVDGRGFAMNGVNGQAVDLNMPLFVNLKGDVNGAKATEAATGSVAYRLGKTVIGAIQGYANSGAGFGFEGRQLESSLVASHSFGGVFLEGQAGSVSAANLHNSDWSGYRSLVTVGFDTSFVSPFVQISHRQLDRNGIHQLNETAGYVGLDVDVANLAADTYSVNTRLLAKVGYSEQAWSNGSKDLGSTSGARGSVEWTAGVNLNSGISFSTNLGLDTLSGSSAGLKVSLDR